MIKFAYSAKLSIFFFLNKKQKGRILQKLCGFINEALSKVNKFKCAILLFLFLNFT